MEIGWPNSLRHCVTLILFLIVSASEMIKILYSDYIPFPFHEAFPTRLSRRSQKILNIHAPYFLMRKLHNKFIINCNNDQLKDHLTHLTYGTPEFRTLQQSLLFLIISACLSGRYSLLPPPSIKSVSYQCKREKNNISKQSLH